MSLLTSIGNCKSTLKAETPHERTLFYIKMAGERIEMSSVNTVAGVRLAFIRAKTPCLLQDAEHVHAEFHVNCTHLTASTHTMQKSQR